MTARRLASLLALGLLASCAPSEIGRGPAAPEASASASDGRAVCRVGPDGGPLLSERGIGGTGAATGAVQSADRGIGGTGTAAKGVQSADKGIGGTGIVGVITGFASICVDGLEVGFDQAAPVIVDGSPAPSDVLRVGQLAAITAAGTDDALDARQISVRHEVSGPVEAVEGGGSVLIVAGQRVVLSGPVWGDATLQGGDWVAVSGVRAPGGNIAATRLDRRAPGRVTVHGPLVGDGGGLHVGGLRVKPVADLKAESGSYVTASGRYANGILIADDVTADVLPTDPAGYFGSGVERFFIESYATVAAGQVRLGYGPETPAASGLDASGTQPRRAIVTFERGPDGLLIATGLRDVGDRTGLSGALPGLGNGLRGPASSLAPAFGPTWTPAPVPNTAPGFTPDSGRTPRPGFGSESGRSPISLRAGDGGFGGAIGRTGDGRGPAGGFGGSPGVGPGR